ncbi:MAG: hypothetical protein IJD57_07650 [Candidatus Gastranaerophilales bacterium]|nr:hypothetical protein [Candidatus Gastranaerophilales bacterium]
MRISFLKNISQEATSLARAAIGESTNLLRKEAPKDVFISSKKVLKKKKFTTQFSQKINEIINNFNNRPKGVEHFVKENTSQDMLDGFNDVVRRRKYSPQMMAKILKEPTKIDEKVLARLEFPNIEKYKKVTVETFKDLPLEDKKAFINQYISTFSGSAQAHVEGLADIPLFKSLKEIDLDNASIDEINKKRFKLLDDLMESVPRGQKEILNSPLNLQEGSAHVIKPPLTNSVKNIQTNDINIHGYKIKVGDLPENQAFYVHNMTQDNLTRLEALLLTDPDAVLCTGFKGGAGYLKGGDRMGVIVSPKTAKDLLVQAPQDASSGYGTTRNLYNIENKFLKQGNIDNEYIPNIIKGELNLSDEEYSKRMQKLIDNGAKYLEDVEKIDPELYGLIKKIPQDYSMFEGIMRPDIEAIYLPKDMEISQRIARFAHDYDIPILKTDAKKTIINPQDITRLSENTDKYYKKPKTTLPKGLFMAGDL